MNGEDRRGPFHAVFLSLVESQQGETFPSANARGQRVVFGGGGDEFMS